MVADKMVLNGSFFSNHYLVFSTPLKDTFFESFFCLSTQFVLILAILLMKIPVYLI